MVEEGKSKNFPRNIKLTRNPSDSNDCNEMCVNTRRRCLLVGKLNESFAGESLFSLIFFITKIAAYINESD